jgi:hypothetical protein
VLKWGTGLPVLTPLAGDNNLGFWNEGEGIWSWCNLGGGNREAPGNIVGGGTEFFSGWGVDESGFEGTAVTEYPREGWGGLAIAIQDFFIK